MAVEVQWSELQRDPKAVAALADRGDVRVRRRDGAALLLTREDRASSTAEGAVTAARALRNVLAHVGAQVTAAALIDEFPWSDVLPEQDRAQFVMDFVRAFQARRRWASGPRYLRRSGSGRLLPLPTLIRSSLSSFPAL